MLLLLLALLLLLLPYWLLSSEPHSVDAIEARRLEGAERALMQALFDWDILIIGVLRRLGPVHDSVFEAVSVTPQCS